MCFLAHPSNVFLKLCARITLSPENISVREEMNSRKNEEFDEILRQNFGYSWGHHVKDLILGALMD